MAGKFLPCAGKLIRLKGGGPLLDKVKSIDENSPESVDKFLKWLSTEDGKKIISMWDDFKSLPKGRVDQTACPVMVALFKKAIGMQV